MFFVSKIPPSISAENKRPQGIRTFFPYTEVHNYGGYGDTWRTFAHEWSYSQKNDILHTKTCTKCGTSWLEEHFYEYGADYCICGYKRPSSSTDYCSHYGSWSTTGESEYTYIDCTTHSYPCVQCRRTIIEKHSLFYRTDEGGKRACGAIVGGSNTTYHNDHTYKYVSIDDEMHQYVCTKCGDVYVKFPHILYNDGSDKSDHCRYCDYVYEECEHEYAAIDLLNGTHDYECTKCGEYKLDENGNKIVENCSYEAAKDDAWGAEGHLLQCSVCEAKKFDASENVIVEPHEWDDELYYEEGENHVRVCKKCGYTETTLEAVTVAPLGHNFVSGVCTRCGKYENTIATGTIAGAATPVEKMTEAEIIAAIAGSSGNVDITLAKNLTVSGKFNLPKNTSANVSVDGGGNTIIFGKAASIVAKNNQTVELTNVTIDAAKGTKAITITGAAGEEDSAGLILDDVTLVGKKATINSKKSDIIIGDLIDETKGTDVKGSKNTTATVDGEAGSIDNERLQRSSY